MAKLFIFGIGGTGARVVKSLTFLLASGVNIKASEIIPIFIDPHGANEDLKRANFLLDCYQKIYDKIEFKNNQFFKTKITKLSELIPTISKAENETNDEPIQKLHSKDFIFTLKDTKNKKFKDFIGYNEQGLGQSNKDFINLLFSEKNLESDMDKGFKGNPNIGSVVLNQFVESPHFRYFAQNFEENDRIFIISSIFGGTGAAGFPLLLKNIRNAKHPIKNCAFLQNAKIGAITILPYFGVEGSDKKDIDEGTFYSKSRAALAYYLNNICGNNSLNVLYYLCDTIKKAYPNDPGEGGQKNDAHIIETIAARMIIDFMQFTNDQILSEDGKAINPIYKEFSTYDFKDEKPMILKNFCDETRTLLSKSLMNYFYFYLYLTFQFKNSIEKQPWSSRGEIKFDANFLNPSEMQDTILEKLNGFNSHYWDWLVEMARNKRSFQPFDLGFTQHDIHKVDLFKLTNGFDEKKFITGLPGKKHFAYFDHLLNKAERKIGDIPQSQKFMSIFYLAAAEFVSKKFNFKEN